MGADTGDCTTTPATVGEPASSPEGLLAPIVMTSVAPGTLGNGLTTSVWAHHDDRDQAVGGRGEPARQLINPLGMLPPGLEAAVHRPMPVIHHRPNRVHPIEVIVGQEWRLDPCPDGDPP